ncbi:MULTISPECIES: ABC transporter permease [unclassified Acidovorax]|uniref:ABC transporter permease n=1 Tax=unclassified Acidovorax TaxID=2684926 RepID=UPI002102D90E|nr:MULTISPECIES: ABC transporter permease [unclassified Acidovorax]
MQSSLPTTLWRHRSLVLELVKREFSSQYRGSFGGIFWSLAQPLFLLTIYIIAFGVILKSRWNNAGSAADYAFMLFAGLIIFNAFSEVLNKSPLLIARNPNFVKKVVFPLELLPVVTVGVAYLQALLGTAILLAGYIVFMGKPSPTVLLFPFILLCFSPMLLGLAWLLSAVGVAVKDIGQLTGMLSHCLLFLTPIFYSMDSAPELLKNLLMLNPLTFIVEQFRLVLLTGGLPSFLGLAVYTGLASAFSWASLILFRRLRTTFADMV